MHTLSCSRKHVRPHTTTPVATFRIQYRDAAGDLTERVVSDVQPHSEVAVSAFCHLRGERRTFVIGNIIAVSDGQTGVALQDPARALGLIKGSAGRTIDAEVNHILAAIKALKFFAKSTRGFRARERSGIVGFIKQNAGVGAYSDEDLDQWLQRLYCGNVSAYQDGNAEEYNRLLAEVPVNQRTACRYVALAIAAGSRRNPISDELHARIEREF